jgi:hypothetical protein
MNNERTLIADNGKVFVGYYTVCLIDILGQRNKLVRWATLPPDGQQNAGFLEALRDTVGIVDGVAEAFRKYFHAIEQHQPMASPTLTQQHLSIQRQLQNCKLSVQQFSDTLVFYSPVAMEGGHISVSSIYRSLTAAALIMLFSLAGKVSLRGAICIGTGLELSPCNFYGPALVEAHQLESEVAKYPRILVSPELATLITTPSTLSVDPMINNISVKLMTATASLLHRDEDGQLCVDFLGRGIQEIFGTGPDTLQLARSAIEFVEDQASHYGNDKKLGPRYQALAAYTKARRSLWGM